MNAQAMPRHLTFTQAAPQLTVEEDMSRGARLGGGLSLALVGLLVALSAVGTLTQGGEGLIGLGLGRLVGYLAGAGMPAAAFLAFLEQAHLAVLLLAGATLLLFGGSHRPPVGPHETLIFHRRASPRRHYPWLLLALALIAAGAWLEGAVHPLVAGLVELPVTTILAWSGWHCLIRESRCSLSVIVDDRQGFANRFEIAGNRFNRSGRLVVLHDQLERASMVEPAWTRLLQYRDLLVQHRDSDGATYRTLIEAAAPEAELSQLQGYLNGAFHYALTRRGAEWVGGMRPWGGYFG